MSASYLNCASVYMYLWLCSVFHFMKHFSFQIYCQIQTVLFLNGLFHDEFFIIGYAITYYVVCLFLLGHSNNLLVFKILHALVVLYIVPIPMYLFYCIYYSILMGHLYKLNPITTPPRVPHLINKLQLSVNPIHRSWSLRELDGRDLFLFLVGVFFSTRHISIIDGNIIWINSLSSYKHWLTVSRFLYIGFSNNFFVDTICLFHILKHWSKFTLL